MDFRYKQLEQDMSALSGAFSELGTRLSEAAKDVTGGVTPSEKLIEQILTARAIFETVRNAVHRQAESMLISPLPKPGEVTSIPAIAALLKTAANAEERKYSAEGERERATAILARVLAITHRETGDFKPLQECLAKIGGLRNAISTVVWPNRHPEAESIIELKHPSTALLHFVENFDALEDEKWMALETKITEAYGKPLFVAASRGKLTAQAAASKPASAPVEKKAVSEKQPEVVSEPVIVEKKTAPPPATAIPVEKPEPPATAERPQPAVTLPVAPVHVTPAPPTAPLPMMVPAAVAQTPPAAAPAASAVVPPRPPAPVPPPPVQPAVTASAPAHIAQQSTPAPSASLSALANATEPAIEKKPAPAIPADGMEKQRKEPRLAAQPPARMETPSQEPELVGESKSLSGDGAQRPQRWGFWRGNR